MQAEHRQELRAHLCTRPGLRVGAALGTSLCLHTVLPCQLQGCAPSLLSCSSQPVQPCPFPCCSSTAHPRSGLSIPSWSCVLPGTPHTSSSVRTHLHHGAPRAQRGGLALAIPGVKVHRRAVHTCTPAQSSLGRQQAAPCPLPPTEQAREQCSDCTSCFNLWLGAINPPSATTPGNVEALPLAGRRDH